MAVPFALACCRLVAPLPVPIVVTVLGLWLAALGTLAAWLLLRRSSLATVAAEVDRLGDLRDELPTAHYFIASRSTSPWIDLQLTRAAATASRVDQERVYPVVVPRAARGALVWLAATIALTLLPPGLARTWWPGTTPPALTSADRDELRALADRLAATDDSATDRERAALNQALAELARDLRQAGLLKPVANALDRGDAGAAADGLRELAQRGTSEAERAALAEALRDAARLGASLPQVRKRLAEAGYRMAQHDAMTAQDALNRAADALDTLAAQQDRQEQAAAAEQDVERLGERLRDRTTGALGSEEPTQDEIAQITADWTQGNRADATQTGGWTGQTKSSGGGRQPAPAEGERPGQSGSGGGESHSADARAQAREADVRLRRAELPSESPDAEGREQEPLVDRASPAATSAVAFRATAAPNRYREANIVQTEPVPADDQDLVKAYFHSRQGHDQR